MESFVDGAGLPLGLVAVSSALNAPIEYFLKSGWLCRNAAIVLKNQGDRRPNLVVQARA